MFFSSEKITQTIAGQKKNKSIFSTIQDFLRDQNFSPKDEYLFFDRWDSVCFFRGGEEKNMKKPVFFIVIQGGNQHRETQSETSLSRYGNRHKKKNPRGFIFSNRWFLHRSFFRQNSHMNRVLWRPVFFFLTPLVYNIRGHLVFTCCFWFYSLNILTVEKEPITKNMLFWLRVWYLKCKPFYYF